MNSCGFQYAVRFVRDKERERERQRHIHTSLILLLFISLALFVVLLPLMLMLMRLLLLHAPHAPIEVISGALDHRNEITHTSHVSLELGTEHTDALVLRITHLRVRFTLFR